MFRRHHRFFQSLQVMRDAAAVAAAFGLARLSRFVWLAETVLPGGGRAAPDETQAVGLLAVAVWPAVAWASGLYASRRTRPAVGEVVEVLRATLVALLIVVSATYFWRDVRYSRAVLLLWAGWTWGLVSLARAATRAALQRLRLRGYNLRHVLLVGAGPLAARVLEVVREKARFGLRAAGSLVLPEEAQRVGETWQGVPVLGTLDDVEAVLAGHPVDQVVVALPLAQMGALKGLMEVLSRQTVDVRLVPDLYQYVTLCGSVEEFGGMPMVSLQATPLVGWNRVLKRAFDAGVAAALLLALAPLLLAIAALVRLTSRGPALYWQERMGMDGRLFAIAKFRTMAGDAERLGGARWATPADPRCTPLGRWLRRLSLDELPQLLNVLCGDMSLVGPRPERPCFIADFTAQVPKYALRHKMKAGMTGWAQVNGLRGNTSLARRLELDLYYIENWSLWFDLQILVRTALGGFLSPHAY